MSGTYTSKLISSRMLITDDTSLEENRVFVFLLNGWASTPSQNVLTSFDGMQVLFPFLRMHEKDRKRDEKCAILLF